MGIENRRQLERSERVREASEALRRSERSYERSVQRLTAASIGVTEAVRNVGKARADLASGIARSERDLWDAIENMDAALAAERQTMAKLRLRAQQLVAAGRAYVDCVQGRYRGRR